MVDLTASADLKNDMRLQDIVAKVSRVKLRETVRVLRALSMVFHTLGDKRAETNLDSWLQKSAKFGGFPSPLHSKADATAIEACDTLYELLLDTYGDIELDALYSLEEDCYYDWGIKTREERDKA